MSGLDPIWQLLLAGLVGAAVGALVAWALAGRRAAERFSTAEARAAAERDRRLELHGELEAAERALRELERESAASGEREAQLRRLAEEQRSFLETSHTQLERTFQALANDALKGSSEQLLKLAGERLGAERSEAAGELERRKQAIEGLLQPVRETLDKLDSRTQDLEKARVDAYSRIDEQIKQLAAAAGRLDEKTTSLATALKNPQVRGTWGEIALRRVVELAGMTEHCDFEEQKTLDGGSRPDMIIHLPEKRHIAVDAKSPLSAFMSAAEASDEEQRNLALARHARDLKAHVNRLATRDYAADVEGELDLVVLFLPGDPFLGAAVTTDPQILEDSLRKKVLIATPTTLIALLRTVALYWQQRELARSAEVIADTARTLYDRAATFGEHLGAVGKGLDAALKAYNEAVGSFDRRLVPMARQLEEMKVAEQSRKRLESPEPIEASPRELADRSSG